MTSQISKGAAPEEASPINDTNELQELEELEEFRRTPEVATRKNSRPWLTGTKGILIGLSIGAIATFGATRISAPKSSPAPAVHSAAPAQSVTVALVKETTVTQTVQATGTVAARDLLPIAPAAMGLKIQQVLVNEGDSVKAGQVLAVLDNSVISAQLNQAQASLRASENAVQQKRAALAQATLTEAQHNFNRYRNLAQQGAISQQDLESRQTATTTAKATVNAAQADIATSLADVQSRAAQVQQLKTQLAQTQVVAPTNGIIAEKLAHVADVTSSSKLFSIIQNGEQELDAKVPQPQLPQIKVGATAQITSDTDPRINFSGIVREITPVLNDRRQATVKINLPSSKLRSGMFLKAAIATNTAPGLSVPVKAVLPQSEGSSIVYVLENNIARARTVQVGAQDNDTITIKSGLKAGDRVIVTGNGYVKDGDRVTVVNQ